MSPRISVCIPVRNGGAFLPLAVDSVLSQRCDDMELIVVDNCSTDGTAQWLERRSAEVKKISFFRNDVDIGLARNFNACLAYATGEYVKFLCADDLLLPGKNYIGEPSAVMFRRSAATRGLSEAFPHLIDLEMWFHLLEQGRLISLTDEVCAIRRHAAQMSHTNARSGALLDDNVRLFEQYGGKPYIRASRARSLSRKARVAYRVWLCRDGISAEKRDSVLKRYSSKLLYHAVIPAFAATLSAWRSLRLLLRAGRA
jgi:glycosyltransferase involved in cell wall biosynthesis